MADETIQGAEEMSLSNLHSFNMERALNVVSKAADNC